MAANLIAFEAIKLALQFAGALFIAWRAVQWALGRYKAEKLWERRLAAYTELLTSLSRMNRVLGVWELEAMNVPQNLSDDEVREVRRRYDDARRDLEEAWGVAQLILPTEIAKLLASLSNDIDEARHNSSSWMQAIGEEWAILDKARRTILDIGRKDLQSEAPPSLRNVIRSSSKA